MHNQWIRVVGALLGNHRPIAKHRQRRVDGGRPDDLIQDLKQFIAATVAQATDGLVTKEDLQAGIGEVRTELGELHTEMLRRFDELEIKVVTIADAHSETLAEQDQRLRRLEQQTA